MLNKNLEPLAIFGMLIIGDQALNMAHVMRVQDMPPDLSHADSWYRITLASGDMIDFAGDDAASFRDQLVAILRHAQFGATPVRGLKS